MNTLFLLGLAICFAGYGLFAWRSLRWAAYPLFLMALVSVFFSVRPLFVIAAN